MQKLAALLRLFARHWVLLALSAFVAVRWFVVLYADSQILALQHEETLYSTMAAERIRGNSTIDDMMYQDYTAGGYWLQTYLYVPLLLAVDVVKHPLAIKWLPILFSAGAFYFFLLWVCRCWGVAAGQIFALLMVFGNPTMLLGQTAGWANHNEVTIFFGPALLLLFAVLFGRNERLMRPTGQAILLGVLLAGAVFYCYSAIAFVTVVNMVMLVLIVRRILAGGRARLAVPAGFYAGQLLGFLVALSLRHRVLYKFFGTYEQIFWLVANGRSPFGPRGFLAWVSKTFEFWGEIGPVIAGYSQRWASVVFAVIMLCAMVGAPLIAARTRRVAEKKSLQSAAAASGPQVVGALLVFGVVVLNFLAYGYSFTQKGFFPEPPSLSRPPQVDAIYWFRYLAVVWPFVFAAIAIVLAAAIQTPRWRTRAPAWAVLACLIVLGLGSLTRWITFKPRTQPVPATVNLGFLVLENSRAIRASYPEVERCERLTAYVRSYHLGKDECRALTTWSLFPCPCPAESRGPAP